LFQKGRKPGLSPLDHCIADQDARDPRDHGDDHGETYAVPGGAQDLGVPEDPALPLGQGGLALSDPVVEGQVPRGIVVGVEHQRLPEEEQKRDEDGNADQRGHEGKRRIAPPPQGGLAPAETFPGDGDEALVADHPLVHGDDEHGDQDQHQGADVSDGRRPVDDAREDRRGQRKIPHRRP